MKMQDVIGQVKWNSYANAELPTKNGRYLVIMPQFIYSDNISLDINVLIYCVSMDEWYYLWGTSVEENKLPLYWAEIDTNDIIDKFNKKESNNNTNENIVDIDAELYIKYMPKSLSVNNHFNIEDVISIWSKDDKLKKYAKIYKYWQDQAVKFLNPICSNSALWYFFIECYKAAKEGRDGFFIERVCYSTNIMWRNEFKFQRLIMSWITGEESNVNVLIHKTNELEKQQKEENKKKENNKEKEVDEDLINHLKELTKLPNDLKLYYNNLRDVRMIWEGGSDITHCLSKELQNEMSEFEFKCVFADYWEMMRGRKKFQEGEIDKEALNRKTWRFWQSCLKMALNEKCNFRLSETHHECSDGRVIFTYNSWSIFWGRYEIISWKREYDENGKCKMPECAYDWVKEQE